MKPLWLPTLNSGVTFWRMFNFWNAGLRNRTMDGWVMWWRKNMTDIHPWQQDLIDPTFAPRILGEMDSNVRKADVVIMGMIHTTGGLDMLMGIREMYGIPVVMEIDDNLLSTPEYNPASTCYGPDSKIRQLTVRQMREADALIVSTPYLKALYSDFNEHIYVIPNSIDFETWGKATHGSNRGKVTIGWAGGASHDDDLEILLPAVKALTDKYPDVQFKFLHGGKNAINGKGIVHIQKWCHIDKYPYHIAKQGFDIGVAPLVDNAFNRAKSNLRWLECGALGIPCVASNVGHFKETIHNGEDGILCDSPADFTSALDSLIKNKALRKNIGKAAKARIYSDFNVDKTTELYRDSLEDIVKRGQIKRAVPEWKDSNFKETVEVTHE